jgi:hypothetical protein
MKIPRNSKCWCGSGKKYKNCHFLTDMREVWEKQPTPQEVDYLKRQTTYFTKKYERLTNGTSVKKDTGKPDGTIRA